MSRNGYAEIEEGDRREPDYEAYQEEAFAATSSTVLISRKYVVSAFCVGLLVLFLVAIILIVGVDILDGGDDDDWWKGKPKEVLLRFFLFFLLLLLFTDFLQVRQCSSCSRITSLFEIGYRCFAKG